MTVKLKLDYETLNKTLFDLADAVVVARVTQSIDTCKTWRNAHPDDRKYYKKYKKAAKMVIGHFSVE